MSAKTRIGINGLGRIGRTILRELQKRQEHFSDIDIVAANNPGDHQMITHLMKYDSLHGTLDKVSYSDGFLTVGNSKMKLFATRKPEEIDWSSQEVDIVIDATGVFKDKTGLSRHLHGSVKKVIMCAPGKDLDATFVYGVSHETYDPKSHHVISNASCTTNCLAPVAKVLNDAFKIKTGLMTTIHAYTSDQNILDGNHRDLRRARAAAMSMIPTSTGAAKAVGLVLPELAGKLDGFAVRVPTPDVSMVDLTFESEKAPGVDEINQAIKEASQGSLKGILSYSDEELVSVDFLGNPHSSIFDSKLTSTSGNLAKIISWYDNEVGFSNRILDLAQYVGKSLR